MKNIFEMCLVKFGDGGHFEKSFFTAENHLHKWQCGVASHF